MITSIDAIVLNKENRAENYISFTLFSKDLGLCYAMIKISKNKNTPLPDFFTEISIDCNKGSYPNSFFIKNINAIESINNFRKNYKGLVECTKLAQCIIKNARHLEDFAPIYNDFALALKAYSPDIDPRIINIKWLYKFTKNEGYPIREDFAESLPLHLQNAFVHTITTPSKACNIDQDTLSSIYNKLTLWINANTDIIYT